MDRRALTLAAVVVLAGGPLTIGPAAVADGPTAGAAEETTCDVHVPGIVLTPGVSTEPSSGVAHTDGPTGTIDCGGRKGTMGFDARYGTDDPDTCAGAEGWGVAYYTFAGEPTIRDTFTWVSKPTEGRGQWTGEYLSGPYTAVPVKGDCLTEPATDWVMTATMTLTR